MLREPDDSFYHEHDPQQAPMACVHRYSAVCCVYVRFPKAQAETSQHHELGYAGLEVSDSMHLNSLNGLEARVEAGFTHVIAGPRFGGAIWLGLLDREPSGQNAFYANPPRATAVAL